jgi:transposase
MKPDWFQYLPQEARAQAEADWNRMASLEADLASLKADLAKVDAMKADVQSLTANVKFLTQKVGVLEEMLRLRRLERYGRKSEKLSEEQLMLLSVEPTVSDQELAQEAELPAAEKEGLIPANKPAQKNQNHPGREPLPAHLPRVEVVIPCPEKEQVCPVCDQIKPVIGYDLSEELCVKPAEYFVKVTKREKRACRRHPEGGVTTAPAPVRILPKSKLSDEVIIDTVVRKYQWHQPLYRQSQMLEREAGVVIDRHTLDDGVMWVGQVLLNLKEPMRQEVFASHYLQADETPVGVKTPQTRGRSHRAFLFQYSQPRGVAVFDFRMGRGREGPREFLEGFTGTLQCDAYAGYDEMTDGPNIRRAGCMAHARRGFQKAHEVDPQETEALVVVEKIAGLYQVEDQARQQELDAAGRLALRQQKSVPLMAELKTQIQKLQTGALPKSALGRACHYALEQWERLEVFLTDGRIEADNNNCENGMRPVALGRKNWMLIGSESAGPKVAAILSVIETCRRLKIDVRKYLKDVLPPLAQYPVPNPAQYTPLAWQKRQQPKTS